LIKKGGLAFDRGQVVRGQKIRNRYKRFEEFVKMKILYLLSQLPERTGSGIYTREMIARADRAGHVCSLVAACSALNPPDIKGIRAEYIRLVRFDEAPLSFPVPGMSDVMPYPSSRFMDLDSGQLRDYEASFERIVSEAVESVKPDIIHSNHLWIMSALARRLFPKIPMAVSCHGTDLRQYRNCPHLRENLLKSLPGVDRVFALSLSQKEEIGKIYGIDGEKIHIVPNGFDPEHFHPGAGRTGGLPFSILYAGKLSRSKGVHQLLETMSHDRLKNVPIHLYLAGSGTGKDEETCRELAKNLEGKVTFCGNLTPEELGGMMRKAHVFILPSYFEGVPLVLIEALASGCRIVASDLPGIRELVSGIPGHWGQLFHLPSLETVDKPYDRDLTLIRDNLVEALAGEILNFLENRSVEPVPFTILSENFSWEKVFHRVESVYRELI
jgi:glycosyltransferase involved in cell wall biosynthesis